MYCIDGMMNLMICDAMQCLPHLVLSGLERLLDCTYIYLPTCFLTMFVLASDEVSFNMLARIKYHA